MILIVGNATNGETEVAIVVVLGGYNGAIEGQVVGVGTIAGSTRPIETVGACAVERATADVAGGWPEDTSIT